MTRGRLAVAGLAVALCALTPSLAGGASDRIVLTSIGPEGPALGSSTYWRSLSGDGRLALFTSDDDALPGADGTQDVYVRSVNSDKTRLVSRASSGAAADDDSSDDPAIAGQGRFVAFSSNASNLPGGEGGIFVRDLKTGKTKLVSKNADGDPADGSDVGRPVLSADGRFVSFEADDDDFPGTDGTTDAYVRDRKQGKTTLISKASDGTPADSDRSPFPSISGNGRFVTFSSDADILPGADATVDLYIRDRRQGTTKLVSKTPGGDPAGSAFGHAGAVSFDGRFVAFASSAASLGADPSGSAYVRDRKQDTTTLVSQTAGGDTAIGDTVSISANGRYVAYESDDDDLQGEDVTTDVFRFDLKTEKTILISRANDGPGTDDSYYPSISGSGSFVAFTSRADNLSDEDDDGYNNAFVRGPLN